MHQHNCADVQKVPPSEQVKEKDRIANIGKNE